MSSFDPQPTLTGRHVGVRPLRRSDYDALYAVASDRLVWEQHPDSDRHQEPVFRALFEESIASGGALLVTDLATGAAIGSSRFHGYSEERSEVEIGWTFLARSLWGGTCNADLKRIMLTHAFRFVRRVVFLVGPDNIRSQRALEKIGAMRAGTRLDGSGRQSVVFEVAAYSWPGLTPGTPGG